MFNYLIILLCRSLQIAADRCRSHLAICEKCSDFARSVDHNPVIRLIFLYNTFRRSPDRKKEFYYNFRKKGFFYYYRKQVFWKSDLRAQSRDFARISVRRETLRAKSLEIEAICESDLQRSENSIILNLKDYKVKY